MNEKYKEILNFCLDIILTSIFCFAFAFLFIIVLGVDYSNERIAIFALIALSISNTFMMMDVHKAKHHPKEEKISEKLTGEK